MAGNGMATMLDRAMSSEFMRTPEHPPAADPERLKYLRSYLRLRFFIGVLGAALPFVLVIAGVGAGDGVQGSLSAYYWTGMRDVFVATCVAIGVFLAFYMVSERNFDNYASYVAGAAVLVVAFFPTEGPAGTDNPAARVAAHYIAAVVFIVLLAAISFRFGWAERVRDDTAGRGARLHFACAAAIVIALVFAGLSQWLGFLTEYSILVAETASVLAFGASWLVKGSELFRTPGP